MRSEITMSKSEKLTGASPKATKLSPAAAEPANEPGSSSSVGEESRQARISEAAFFRAASRAFAPGHEWDDWFAAEKEIEAQSGRAVRKDAHEDTSGAALRPDPNSRIWSS
jgi:hypothetical protein